MVRGRVRLCQSDSESVIGHACPTAFFVIGSDNWRWMPALGGRARAQRARPTRPRRSAGYGSHRRRRRLLRAQVTQVFTGRKIAATTARARARARADETPLPSRMVETSRRRADAPIQGYGSRDGLGHCLCTISGRRRLWLRLG